EDCEVEVHEVIDRVEILGPGRMAKAWRGRCRDLAMAAEKIEKDRLGTDCVEAVQGQDRAPDAAAHHFELDPLYPQPFGIGIDHRARPPVPLLRVTYSRVRRRSETALGAERIPLLPGRNPKRHAEWSRFSPTIACVSCTCASSPTPQGGAGQRNSRG